MQLKKTSMPKKQPEFIMPIELGRHLSKEVIKMSNM